MGTSRECVDACVDVGEGGDAVTIIAVRVSVELDVGTGTVNVGKGDTVGDTAGNAVFELTVGSGKTIAFGVAVISVNGLFAIAVSV